jgi:hypothetical protein
MNTKESRELIAQELETYRVKSYLELVGNIGETIVFQKYGPSGTQYQIEILIIWDSTPNGAIRVLGSIDDGGLRALVPLIGSILKHPVKQ